MLLIKDLMIFWLKPSLLKNRDFLNKSKLKELGWNVIDLWECTLVKKELTKTMLKLERMLSLTLN